MISRRPALFFEFVRMPVLSALWSALPWIFLAAATATAVAAAGSHRAIPLPERQKERRVRKAPLEIRMGMEQLRNPFWYEAHGQPEEARAFWDRAHWER